MAWSFMVADLWQPGRKEAAWTQEVGELVLSNKPSARTVCPYLWLEYSRKNRQLRQVAPEKECPDEGALQF